jgi:ERCC4-type nuclease
MLTIIIDSREPNEVVELVKKLNYPVQQHNLEVGDIQIGNILIERKDIGDLVNSVRDNRLWQQLYNMKQQEGYKSFLIVIGDLQNTIHPGIKDIYRYAQYVKNLLLSVQVVCFLSYGVYFIHCKDTIEFLEILKLLVQRAERTDSLKPVQKKPKSLDDAVVEMLGCIPKVGRKLAYQIAQQFSIAELSNMPENSLQELKIGDRKLGIRGISIYQTLHHKIERSENYGRKKV